MVQIFPNISWMGMESPLQLKNYDCGCWETTLLFDFPGGLVDKNPPANAGDMDSIPAPGKSHITWGN